MLWPGTVTSHVRTVLRCVSFLQDVVYRSGTIL
jgi:hypothetical protein